jgi:hypothetical protein
MASLVLKLSISLDGYIASIDGSTDWIRCGRLRWPPPSSPMSTTVFSGGAVAHVFAAHP